jgi:hypothetical protein
MRIVTEDPGCDDRSRLISTARGVASSSGAAQASEVEFLDAGSLLEVSPVDGFHVGSETHRRLRAAVAEAFGRLWQIQVDWRDARTFSALIWDA